MHFTQIFLLVFILEGFFYFNFLLFQWKDCLLVEVLLTLLFSPQQSHDLRQILPLNPLLLVEQQ